MAEKIDLHIGPYRCGKTSKLINMVVDDNLVNHSFTRIIAPSKRSLKLITEKIQSIAAQKGQKVITGFKLETFYEFCSNLLNKLNCPKQIIKNEFRVIFLIKSIKSLQSDFKIDNNIAKELLLLFDEFQRAFLTPRDLINILQKTSANDTEFLQIANFYDCYWNYLKDHNLVDQKMMVFDLIQILAETKFFDYNNILIEGFDRFNNLQIALFRHLMPFANKFSMTFDYDIYNNCFPKAYHWKISSFELLKEKYSEIFNFIEYQSVQFKKIDKIYINSYHDITQEISKVASQVKYHIVNNKINTQDLAVIIPDGSNYNFDIFRIFDDACIPYYFDTNLRLSQFPIIKTIIKLLGFGINDLNFNDFLEIINSKFIYQNYFDSDDITKIINTGINYNIIEGKTQWINALKQSNDDSIILNKFDDFIENFKKANYSNYAFNHAQYFENLIHKFIIPQLKNLGCDEYVNFELNDYFVKSCLNAIKDILFTVVNEINYQYDSKITLEFFYLMVEKKISDYKIPNPNFHKNGVLVTSLFQIPNRHFKKIFCLGFNDDFLNKTNISLYNNAEQLRKWCGYEVNLKNPRHDVDYDLAILFLVVLNATESVYFSYSRYDILNNEYSINSILKKRVFWQYSFEDIANEIIENQIDNYALSFNDLINNYIISPDDIIKLKNINFLESKDLKIINKLQIESNFNFRFRQTTNNFDFVDLNNDFIENKIWSSSQFNEYGKCPFKFFMSSVLKYKITTRPYYQLQLNIIGQFYHKVLELLFNEIIKNNISNSDVDKILELFDNIFSTQIDILSNSIAWSNSLRWSLKKFEFKYKLKRFLLETFINNNITLSYPVCCEFKFGFDDKCEVQLINRKIAIRGSIDRIDRDSGDNYCLIDYKLKSSSITKEDVFSSTETQLPLYSIVFNHLTNNKIVNGYYLSVNKADKLFSFMSSSHSNSKYSINEFIENTKINLENYINDIEDGIFRVKPSHHKHCKNCDFQNMCGIRQNILGQEETDE